MLFPHQLHSSSLNFASKSPLLFFKPSKTMCIVAPTNWNSLFNPRANRSPPLPFSK